MSLINQMLKDLEQRNAEQRHHGDAAEPTPRVVPLRVAEKDARPWRGRITLGVLLIGGTVGLAMWGLAPGGFLTGIPLPGLGQTDAVRVSGAPSASARPAAAQPTAAQPTAAQPTEGQPALAQPTVGPVPDPAVAASVAARHPAETGSGGDRPTIAVAASGVLPHAPSPQPGGNAPRPSHADAPRRGVDRAGFTHQTTGGESGPSAAPPLDLALSPSLGARTQSGLGDTAGQGAEERSLRRAGSTRMAQREDSSPGGTPEVIPSSRQAQERGPSEISKQVKDLTPDQRAESDYRKAVSMIQQGRVAEALDLLGGTLTHNPRHVSARQAAVGLLVESGRNTEAEKLLEAGLRLDGSQIGFAMILARLQVERGADEAALTTLLRSAGFAAARADYQAFLGTVLQRRNRHPEAIEHYLQAVRLSPQTGSYWLGLGMSLQAEGRHNEAQSAFRQASESGNLPPALQEFAERRGRP